MPTHPRTWLAAVTAFVARQDQRDRELLERRTFAEPSATLQELAEPWQITRERVRQLEQRLLARCHEIDGAELDAALRRARAACGTGLTRQRLPGFDATFAGVEHAAGIFTGLLRSFSTEHALLPIEGYGDLIVEQRFAEFGKLVARCRNEVLDVAPIGADRSEKEASLRVYLRGLAAEEYFDAVVARLVFAGPGVLEPSIPQRIETVLRRSGRPLDWQELCHALQPTSERKVAAALGRARIVHVERGRYALPPPRASWSHLLPQAGEDILDFLSCVPEQQWHAAELLPALSAAGASWAEGLPLTSFECLLAEVEGVVSLQRSYWGLAGVHERRLGVLELAITELTAAGEPLPMRELMQRIRRHRSAGGTWRPRFPVVLIGDGRVGLGPRDLGLTADAFAAWTAAITTALAGGQPLQPGRLTSLLQDAGGPALALERCQSILLGEQTLYARLRRQLAAPLPGSRAPRGRGKATRPPA